MLYFLPTSVKLIFPLLKKSLHAFLYNIPSLNLECFEAIFLIFIVKIVINIQIYYYSLRFNLYEGLFLSWLLNVLNVTQTNINNNINQLVMAEKGGNPLDFILPGAGLVTGLIGNIFSGGQKRKAMGVIDDQIADLTAWKDIGTNIDPLKTNVGKSIMQKSLDRAKTKARNIESTGAITGASEEKQIAEKAGVQKGLSDTASNLAAYGSQRADQIEGQYRSNLSNLLSQKAGMLMGNAQSGANLAGSAGSFLQGLAPLYAENKPNVL
jgi:hypothetical protein